MTPVNVMSGTMGDIFWDVEIAKRSEQFPNPFSEAEAAIAALLRDILLENGHEVVEDVGLM